MILIGGGLLALAGTLNGEVGKTGKTILNWSGSVSSIPAGGGIGDNRTGVEIPDPENGTAFAVYSEDDHSLDFYKRKAVPEVGSTFEGKVVTEVYTGFETTEYAATWDEKHSDVNNGPTNCPWYEHHKDILSVKAVDAGIKPKCMNFWFQLLTSVQEIDIQKIDASSVRHWRHTFWHCESLQEIDLTGMNVKDVGSFNAAFNGCSSIKSINLGDWSWRPYNCSYAFCGCPNLKVLNLGTFDPSGSSAFTMTFRDTSTLKMDCSGWSVMRGVSHGDFATNAPGIIEPKWVD